MKNETHLPMMGVGPVYVAVIIAVTLIAVIAEKTIKLFQEVVKFPFRK